MKRSKKKFKKSILKNYGIIFSFIIFYAFYQYGDYIVSIFSISLISYLVYKLALMSKNTYQLSSCGIEEIDEMDGAKFEERLALLFKQRGYENVKVTPKSGDFGADIVMQKNGDKIAVQAKRSSRVIGVKALYEVLGGAEYYKANKKIVVTNRWFTKQAKELAKKSNIELWDRKKLISELVASK